jgi:hypothetical protein
MEVRSATLLLCYVEVCATIRGGTSSLTPQWLTAPCAARVLGLPLSIHRKDSVDNRYARVRNYNLTTVAAIVVERRERGS